VPDLGELGAAEQETDAEAEPTTFGFHGERFSLPARIGSLPLMRFAAAAEADVNIESMAGKAAVYSLIRAVVDPADWPRFEKTANAHAADTAELLDVCTAILVHFAGRPTVRPSDSSDGPPATTENSRDDSSSKAARLGLVPVEEATRRASSA
jgi:hypothetical protein